MLGIKQTLLKNPLDFQWFEEVEKNQFRAKSPSCNVNQSICKIFFFCLKWHKIEAEMIFQRGSHCTYFFPSIGNDDHDDDNDKISVISWTYAASFVKQCFNVNVFLMIFAKVCREMKWVKECEFALVLQIKYFIWKTVETKEILKN